MKLVWVLLLATACKGSEAKKVPPPEPKPVEVVEKDLLTAACLMTETPATNATGHSQIAVIQTADGKRYPWIIRGYQHIKVEDLEREMNGLTMKDSLVEGMFPTFFCKLRGPAFATIRLATPGEPNSWLWSGKVGALTKEQTKGILDDESAERGITLVLDAIKAAGGTKPTLVEFHDGKDARMTGLSGAWEDAFEKLAASY